MNIHRCPSLSQFSTLKHGFFEAGSNWTQSIESMAGQPLPLVTLKQVHGNKVIKVTEPWEGEREGDGMVTQAQGIALGILTADCGSVLFYDPKAHVIGACHAGWRGAQAGILQATITVMEELGATRSNIYATLGPTIQQENYEVGPEFLDLIGEPYETCFYPSERSNHHYFDLPRYIFQQLLAEKIENVHDIQCDTFTGNFASRRRFLAEGKQKMHSHNLSAIAIH